MGLLVDQLQCQSFQLTAAMQSLLGRHRVGCWTSDGRPLQYPMYDHTFTAAVLVQIWIVETITCVTLLM